MNKGRLRAISWQAYHLWFLLPWWKHVFNWLTWYWSRWRYTRILDALEKAMKARLDYQMQWKIAFALWPGLKRKPHD